jgi:hypothetical protein
MVKRYEIKSRIIYVKKNEWGKIEIKFQVIDVEDLENIISEIRTIIETM